MTFETATELSLVLPITELSHPDEDPMKKILVVDDDEDVRSAIVFLLEDTHYEILEAEDGASAFDLAVLEQPDLIISDVMMDNGNGFALRELLRRDGRTAAIRIVMMTGAAQGAGAWGSDPRDGYLLKPFTAETILSEVSRILSN